MLTNRLGRLALRAHPLPALLKSPLATGPHFPYYFTLNLKLW